MRVKRYICLYLRGFRTLVCNSGSSLGINRGNANKEILLGIISKLYRIQGTNITKAITMGNNTVQQKDINWSKRIRGKDALTQIKTKIRTQDLKPRTQPLINPSIKGLYKDGSLKSLSVKLIHKSKYMNCIK